MAVNGRFPDSLLTYLSWPEASYLRLRTDAAASIGRLATAFRRDMGIPLRLTDAYRTYATQVKLKAEKGKFAATPGTSLHGWGIAVDAASNINVWGSPQRNWMVANAPRHGWTSPAWAQLGQSTPEAWHWEHA